MIVEIIIVVSIITIMKPSSVLTGPPSPPSTNSYHRDSDHHRRRRGGTNTHRFRSHITITIATTTTATTRAIPRSKPHEKPNPARTMRRKYFLPLRTEMRGPLCPYINTYKRSLHSAPIGKSIYTLRGYPGTYPSLTNTRFGHPGTLEYTSNNTKQTLVKLLLIALLSWLTIYKSPTSY